ncbi:MAG: hypothetical protein H7Y61_12455 [Rhizobiales bacterium]|nr:hypothetical protein [Rhizobacter sp.]
MPLPTITSFIFFIDRSPAAGAPPWLANCKHGANRSPVRSAPSPRGKLTLFASPSGAHEIVRTWAPTGNTASGQDRHSVDAPCDQFREFRSVAARIGDFHAKANVAPYHLGGASGLAETRDRR